MYIYLYYIVCLTWAIHITLIHCNTPTYDYMNTHLYIVSVHMHRTHVCIRLFVFVVAFIHSKHACMFQSILYTYIYIISYLPFFPHNISHVGIGPLHITLFLTFLHTNICYARTIVRECERSVEALHHEMPSHLYTLVHLKSHYFQRSEHLHDEVGLW